MSKGTMGSGQFSVVSSKPRYFNLTSICISMATFSFKPKQRKLSLTTSEKKTLEKQVDQLYRMTAAC